jgi:fumarate hydratase subunit beta
VISVSLPLLPEKAASLKAGDEVLLCGPVYTARDAAHRRFMRLLDEGMPLPFDIRDQVIYYVGPTPAPPGAASGAAGPTTSSRMDSYTPRLLSLGLRGMIGKGVRSMEVIESIKAAGAVYFGAIGGCGALLAQKIVSSRLIAFEDLESEAVRLLIVENFPATVIVDCHGNDFYKSGPRAYLASRR